MNIKVTAFTVSEKLSNIRFVGESPGHYRRKHQRLVEFLAAQARDVCGVLWEMFCGDLCLFV